MLQICKNGRWHGVCDHFWDCDDAKVACRQLGFNQGRYTFSQNGLYKIYFMYIHQKKHMEKHLEKDLEMMLTVSSQSTMPLADIGALLWIMLYINAMDLRIVYQSAHQHKVVTVILPLGYTVTITVFQQSQSVLVMMSVLLAVVDHMKEGWRCVTMGSGHQYAVSV